MRSRTRSLGSRHESLRAARRAGDGSLRLCRGGHPPDACGRPSSRKLARLEPSSARRYTPGPCSQRSPAIDRLDAPSRTADSHYSTEEEADEVICCCWRCRVAPAPCLHRFYDSWRRFELDPSRCPQPGAHRGARDLAGARSKAHHHARRTSSGGLHESRRRSADQARPLSDPAGAQAACKNDPCPAARAWHRADARAATRRSTSRASPRTRRPLAWAASKFWTRCAGSDSEHGLTPVFPESEKGLGNRYARFPYGVHCLTVNLRRPQSEIERTDEKNEL